MTLNKCFERLKIIHDYPSRKCITEAEYRYKIGHIEDCIAALQHTIVELEYFDILVKKTLDTVKFLHPNDEQ